MGALRAGRAPVVDIRVLAQGVEDGDRIAVAAEFDGFFSAAPVALAAELIRARRRRLDVVYVPTNGLVVDLLIGGGCVSSVEGGATILEGHGAPPRFLAATAARTLQVRDSTCPAVLAALTAAERGAPFLTVPGLIGSDLAGWHPEWLTIANPYDPTEVLTLVPPIQPDVAVFHVPRADEHGNVWIGRRHDLALMAHASRSTLVTTEEVVSGSLMEKDDGIGVLSNLYVSAVAEAPGGSWPLSCPPAYDMDTDAVARYVEAAESAEGFAQFVQQRLTRPAALVDD